jgi:hypothetical protein
VIHIKCGTSLIRQKSREKIRPSPKILGKGDMKKREHEISPSEFAG